MDGSAVGGIVGGVIGLVLVLVVGLVIGVVAKVLMPGKDPGGWIMTALLGIAGSWIGGFVFGALGLTGLASSLIGAVLGAMLLLGVYRIVKK